MNEGEFHLMNAGEFHLISHWQFSIRKGGIFRPSAYSLAPRHFRIAQRRTERCKERACPEPAEGRGCAEAYMGTASQSVEIVLVPPPQAVAKSAGGPTPPGGKGPFPDGNSTG